MPNNNFQFIFHLFLQLIGSAMATKFAPPSVCLSPNYLKETILFLRLLRWFCFITKNANIDVFSEVLNELNLSLKFTVEKGKIIVTKFLIDLYKF